MKNKLLLGLVAIAAVFAMGSTTAMASTGTFRDGPYSSTSSDSGTCGSDWAIDLFTRTFIAHLPAVNGQYNVTENFTKGHFLTVAGQSPQACDLNNPTGATVKEGVTGTMHGTFGIVVSNGTFDPSGSCVRASDGQCTTAGWVEGFFGTNATYDVPTFSFVYKAAPSQGLTSSQWTNADTGNLGDISSP